MCRTSRRSAFTPAGCPPRGCGSSCGGPRVALLCRPVCGSVTSHQAAYGCPSLCCSSCSPACCVPVSHQAAVCLPVSCQPVLCTAPSCQPPGPTLLCRPVPCSSPSCR